MSDYVVNQNEGRGGRRINVRAHPYMSPQPIAGPSRNPIVAPPLNAEQEITENLDASVTENMDLPSLTENMDLSITSQSCEPHQHDLSQLLLMSKFECAVCFETYVEDEEDDKTSFLMPKSCTHPICFKCVINVYSANNRPIRCPTCNTNVSVWIAPTKHAIVECRLSKKGTQASIDAAFINHWNILNQRHKSDATTPAEDAAISTSNALLAAENQRKVTDLQNELTAVRMKESEFERKLAEADNRAFLTRQELEAVKEQHNKCQQELNKVKSINEKLNVQNHTEKVTYLETRVRILKANLVRANNSVIDLKDQNSKLNNTIAEANSQLKKLQKETQKYHEKVNNAINQRQTLEAQTVCKQFNVKQHKQFEIMLHSSVEDLFKRYAYEFVDRIKGVQNAVYGPTTSSFNQLTNPNKNGNE